MLKNQIKIVAFLTKVLEVLTVEQGARQVENLAFRHESDFTLLWSSSLLFLIFIGIFTNLKITNKLDHSKFL